jgi:ubiquinol-cytochrome c reductase cytochrome b subunit
MAHGPREPFENKFVEWVDSRLPVFTMIQKEYGVFPTPKNFNYFWNFGALAMVMLVVMIATGVVLAMQYVPNAAMAFNSVERITRDVNYGWLLRYLHMNGASMFFIAVYIHIFRGLYYGSYKNPRELLWIFGIIIFLLMMATAFMGYTLPWSQMSGWGATVITSLFSAIPVIGKSLVMWLWGGFSVDNPTLNRFFALHYLLPFVIVAVVGLHVWALHVVGSNNPTGIDPKGPQDTLPFNPYYTIKDTFGLSIFLIVYALLVFYAPTLLTHQDHFIPFNPMVTPAHIVPEWYFLPFYAILRSITFDFSLYLVVAGAIGGVLAYNYCWKKTPNAMVAKNTGALIAGAVIFSIPAFLLAFCKDIEALKGVIAHIPRANVHLIEAKLGGVLAMFGSIFLLAVLPWLDTHPVRSGRYRPWYRIALIALVIDLCLLGYVGSQPAEQPFITIGQLTTLYYFMFFLVIVPWLSNNEPVPQLPNSIHEAVLAESK